ncbi:MAG: hypothetical protein R3A47_04685 [Polyangiales bacterium]
MFSAAIAVGGWLVALALAGILLSVLGAFYYLKVLVYLYMQDGRNAPICVR